MIERWSPGDSVVLRELWDGRVWSIRPLTVVKDETDEVMLYFWPDLHMKVPVGTHTGELLRLPIEPWELRDQHVRSPRVLSFAWPAISHAVLGLWDDATDRFTGWYVNMETPLRRRPFGFDSTEDFLDIVISPDLETWSWKDEDELEEAVRRGLVTEERAQELWAEGERALERLRRRDRPFDRDWSHWRPDPTWSHPTIPIDPGLLR